MTRLDQILERGAGRVRAGFSSADVERRVDGRRRRRRGLLSIGAVLVVLGAAAGGVALRSPDPDDQAPADRPAPDAPVTITVAPTTIVDPADTCGPIGPTSSSTTFEILLPDGRRAQNVGNNEWVVDVTPGEPVTLEVTATIAPGVVLASLGYEVDGPGNRTVHRVDAGTDVAETVTTVVTWDGTADDGEALRLGRHHLLAEATIGEDDRDPCFDMTGGQERWGLGYLVLT